MLLFFCVFPLIDLYICVCIRLAPKLNQIEPKMKEIFVEHVLRDQLNYVVNNSKLAQPSKVPSTKTPL